MKRRKFLKTVGAVTGAAALGACDSTNSKRKKTGPTAGQTAKGQTVTYQMGAVDVGSPLPIHFQKRTRKVGWWPDAADWSGADSRDRLFQEESFGIVGGGLVPFGIEFQPTDEGSKRWVLGKKLPKHTDPGADPKFTLFVRRLARRARQYNASLYRLRRLHFYFKYQNIPNNLGTVKWPKGTDKWGNSPWGSKPGQPDPVKDASGFTTMASEAETDWKKVTDDFHQYLCEIQENGSSTLEPDDGQFDFRLVAFDVVTVNGYIMSLRVVVDKPQSGQRPKEVGGSSMHVSLSSAFSSHSP